MIVALDTSNFVDNSANVWYRYISNMKPLYEIFLSNSGHHKFSFKYVKKIHREQSSQAGSLLSENTLKSHDLTSLKMLIQGNSNDIITGQKYWNCFTGFNLD